MDNEFTPSENFKKLSQSYGRIAISLLNLFVLFVVCNLLSIIPINYYNDNVQEDGPLAYGMDKLVTVYPNWEPDEIETLLWEMWSREQIYQPFVQHKEASQTGNYVNINSNGYREVANQAAWPLDEDKINVFIFGGSTTFGYGVADDKSIPSQIQQIARDSGCIDLNVYNFGRGNYYSRQESILLQQLLLDGNIPNAVVFIDGLNEWTDEPKYTDRLSYLMGESNSELQERAIKSIPIVELAKIMRDIFSQERVQSGESFNTSESYGEKVVERWLLNRQMIEEIAESYDVVPLFVWQPVPTYQYNLESHAFYEESKVTFEHHGALQHGYEFLDSKRNELDTLTEENGFLWLANMQLGRNENFYVDAAHYTEEFSTEIAHKIVPFLLSRFSCGQ